MPKAQQQPDLQHCPKCHAKLSDSFLRKAGASAQSRARKVFSGRQKQETPCEWCDKAFGVAAMRIHKPRCPKKPKKRRAPVAVSRTRK